MSRGKVEAPDFVESGYPLEQKETTKQLQPHRTPLEASARVYSPLAVHSEHHSMIGLSFISSGNEKKSERHRAIAVRSGKFNGHPEVRCVTSNIMNDQLSRKTVLKGMDAFFTLRLLRHWGRDLRLPFRWLDDWCMVVQYTFRDFRGYGKYL